MSAPSFGSPSLPTFTETSLDDSVFFWTLTVTFVPSAIVPDAWPSTLVEFDFTFFSSWSLSTASAALVAALVSALTCVHCVWRLLLTPSWVVDWHPVPAASPAATTPIASHFNVRIACLLFPRGPSRRFRRECRVSAGVHTTGESSARRLWMQPLRDASRRFGHGAAQDYVSRVTSSFLTSSPASP